MKEKMIENKDGQIVIPEGKVDSPLTAVGRYVLRRAHRKAVVENNRAAKMVIFLAGKA